MHSNNPDLDSKLLDLDVLLAEYELEFGRSVDQILAVIDEEMSLEQAMVDEFCAEYTRNPAKKHLRKYMRTRLEEDMGL